MLIIGLILILIALVVVGFMAFGNASTVTMEIDLGVMTANLNGLQLFGLGAACVLVLTVGLLFLTLGLRRSRRKRKELTDLRRKASEVDRQQTPPTPPPAASTGAAHPSPTSDPTSPPGQPRPAPKGEHTRPDRQY